MNIVLEASEKPWARSAPIIDDDGEVQVPAFTNPTNAATFPTVRDPDGEISLPIPQTTGAETIEINVNGARYVTISAGYAKYKLRGVVDGSLIEFIVRNEAGNGTIITGPTVGVVAPPKVDVTGLPVIVGNLFVGESLSIDMSGLSHPQGVPPIEQCSVYWLRSGNYIGDPAVNVSARNPEYVLKNADANSAAGYSPSLEVGVEVWWTDGNGYEQRVRAVPRGPVTVPVSNSAPTGQLVITGNTVEGSTLTIDTSAIQDADGLGPFTYRWYRNNVIDPAMTSQTYVNQASDDGVFFVPEIEYTDGVGKVETIVGDVVGPITALGVNSPAAGKPSLVGNRTVGATLTAGPGTITDSDGTGAYTYEFMLDDVVVTANTTADTITLVEADVDKIPTVAASFLDGAGNPERRVFTSSTRIASNGGPVTVPSNTYIVDSINGSDSNNGLTEATAWKTVSKAFNTLTAGDTAWFRSDGSLDAYYEVAGIRPANNGTSSNKITFESYPGEHPVFSAGIPDFRGPNHQGAWEIFNAEHGLYRSTRSNFSDEKVRGTWLDPGTDNEYMMVTHRTNRSANYDTSVKDRAYGLEDLNSAEHRVSALPRYIGPGCFATGGRIYARMEKPLSSALGDPGRQDYRDELAAMSTVSPLTHDLNLSQAPNLINLRSGSGHLVFKGIEFRDADEVVNITSGCNNISFIDCINYCQTFAHPVTSSTPNIELNGVNHNLVWPLYVAWTDLKGTGAASMPAQNNKTSFVNADGMDGFKMINCRAKRIWDGCVITGNNMLFEYNRVTTLDDFMQSRALIRNTHVRYNHIIGPGPNYNGGNSAPEPGTTYVYENKIDGAGAWMLWGRQGPAAIKNGYRGWKGQKAISSHGTPTNGASIPMHYVNNTMTSSPDDGSSAGLELYKDLNPTSGVYHTMVNNIVVIENGAAYKNRTNTNNRQVYNGNLYEIRSGTKFSTGPSHNTLASFLAGTNPRNYDVNSREGPAQLDSNLNPLPGSPAIGNAIPIPAHLSGIITVSHNNIGSSDFNQAVTASSFVSITTSAVAANSMNVQTTYTAGSTNRTEYWPTSTPSSKLQTPPETSLTYSVHNQTISGLIADTEYTLQAQTTADNGSTWQNAGAPITETTSAASGFVAIASNQWTTTNVASTTTYSADWTGQNGFVADSGSTDAYRVQVDQNGNFGASEIVELTGTPKHVIMRYRVLVPADIASFWQESDANMKMPGPAGDVSAANGGYGGSQGSSLAHDQRAWSARGQMHRPHSSFQDFAMGQELYWQGSTNPGSANEFDNENGDTIWYSSSGSISGAASITPAAWHEVKIEVKMNDLNVDNGYVKTSLNGVVGHDKQNFQFSKSASQLLIKRLWFDVFHGGGAKGSAGTLSLFFREFEYQIIA